jgi:uncharacterized protein (TIGR00725 family)
VIAVVGPGGDSVDDAVLRDAELVGALLAQAGRIVVTGGLDGVMAAASRGAQEAGGTAVALIPGDDPTAANPYVLVVCCADAVIAVGASWGTLSEVAIAMRLAKPVVWLHGWQVTGAEEEVPAATTPEQAVASALSAARGGQRPTEPAPQPSSRSSSPP